MQVNLALNYTEHRIKSNFSFREKYSKRHPCGVVANCIGLSIIVFAILVVYLVANPRFKRLTEVEVDKYKWGQEMPELEIEDTNKPN